MSPVCVVFFASLPIASQNSMLISTHTYSQHNDVSLKISSMTAEFLKTTVSPANVSSTVDFPDPDGPMMAIMDPGSAYPEHKNTSALIGMFTCHLSRKLVRLEGPWMYR